MLTFSLPTDSPRGTISSLLRESYGALREDPNLDWERFAAAFDEFDRDVFNHDYIAACTFITAENGKSIGVGSFDPRKRPAYGDVGHNCILPSAQGKGYGLLQLQEILRRIHGRGIKTARVSTGVGPFFEPARAMYASCGFLETRRFKMLEYPQGEMVEYELPLEQLADV